MSKALAWISVSVGGFATLITLMFSSQFFFIARGAHIRPMGWAMYITLLAGITLALGVLPAMYALFTPSRRLAAIGLGLSLLPYPLSVIMIQIASAFCGFTLSR